LFDILSRDTIPFSAAFCNKMRLGSALLFITPETGKVQFRQFWSEAIERQLTKTLQWASICVYT